MVNFLEDEVVQVNTIRQDFQWFCHESRIQWNFTFFVGSSLSGLGGQGEAPHFSWYSPNFDYEIVVNPQPLSCVSAPYSQGIPIPFPILLMWLRSWIFSPLVLFSLTQIVTFNNKANDVSLRVSAIDYLGVVAAHLRKDAVNSQQDTESITEILIEVTEGEKFYKKIMFFVAVYTVSCNLRWISGKTYFKPVC